ncbi:MAG: 50S ribosomal protein L25 [Spirochaetes bacterium]|jgi:large subunit ribosomal protein L25|nr:50S ribosomal protein L25 [Spirochaetota bacterium]
MGSLVLKAEKRSETGKNINRRLRASGMIPAVVYSHGVGESISVCQKEFTGLFKGHISESVILTLMIDGKEQDAYIKDYQKHPVTDQMIHLDFFKVTDGEKIHTFVALEFVGSPAGVKKGGVFEPIEREIEVEVLPRDLLEKIVVDVTKLEIGESVHISDLKVPDSMSFKQDASHSLAHVVTLRTSDDEEPEEESEVIADAE